MIRRRRYKRTYEWSIFTWLFVLTGSALLPYSVAQSISHGSVTEVTLIFSCLGAFCLGRVFEKLWFK